MTLLPFYKLAVQIDSSECTSNTYIPRLTLALGVLHPLQSSLGAMACVFSPLRLLSCSPSCTHGWVWPFISPLHPFGTAPCLL